MNVFQEGNEDEKLNKNQKFQEETILAFQASLQSPKSSPRPVWVYACGIYDFFHFDYALSLEQAKKLFPNTYLVVGCCNDEVTQRFTGKMVMCEAEHYESLWHCKWVDEVIPNAPWVITQEFLNKHHIDYVADDTLPYADATGHGSADVYDFVRKAGKFEETRRTNGVSTSEFLMRIIKDDNQYVMRNLARGYKWKDLGVSYAKEKLLRVNMGMKKLKQTVKDGIAQMLGTVAGRVNLQHEEWVESADRWVTGFLKRFEETYHSMENAIKVQLKKGLLRPRHELNISFPHLHS